MPELLMMAAVLLLLWGAHWLRAADEPSASRTHSEASASARPYLDRLFGPASTRNGPPQR
jgi:hypothetical protein